MNPTPQSPGQAFRSGPNAMDDRTLFTTLAASTVLAFTFLLVLWMARSGRTNPLPRVPFGLLVTVLPALGAYLVLRVTNIFISWRGAVVVYIALFVLAVIIQAFGRLIPVA